ncbi:MAG: helix-turn-helix transcriptional regulator [Lachnospiraceae bacterium]|nr:helix-turn-helix transcriptional regulator [Lachnospiraceae bacterium]
MNTIGKRIEILRKDLGLSRRAFGEKLSVTESVIVNIEYDRLKRPNQKDSLYKLICNEFNVDENWLLTGEGEMYIEVDRENQLMIWAADVLKDESDSFRRRFVKALSELGEEEWELIEKFALKLLNRENNDKN